MIGDLLKRKARTAFATARPMVDLAEDLAAVALLGAIELDRTIWTAITTARPVVELAAELVAREARYQLGAAVDAYRARKAARR